MAIPAAAEPGVQIFVPGGSAPFLATITTPSRIE
jgi:hypothetical protein